jgi:hypothetical protein
MKDGILSIGFKLPAAKVRGEELPHDAVKRLIKKQFNHLAPEALLQFEEMLLGQATRQVDSEEKVSQAFGINSRYVKNEFCMEVGPEWFEKDGSKVLPRSGSKGSGWLRRFAGESNDSLPQVTEHEAFAKVDPEDPDRVVVLAWLDPAVMKLLSSGSGEGRLRDWIYSFKDELMDMLEGGNPEHAGLARVGSLIGRRLSRKASKAFQSSPRKSGADLLV